jgi:glutamate synthase domain-containing protein 3
MSGGIAYVLDEDGTFAGRCNHSLVGLEALGPEDEDELLRLLVDHSALTGSTVAARLLDDWDPDRFVKVLPHDYRRALAETAAELERAAA